MAVVTVIEAIRDAMREEMQRDGSVFVMGEDVGRRGGVFLATKDFLDEFGEQRVVDTPLAEASIAGIAVGAALSGLRPIAEVQFADFIWPTVNQMIGEAARIRYGSNGKLNVPMVLRSPYGGHVRGGLYHSQSVESYFAPHARAEGRCSGNPVRREGSPEGCDPRRRTPSSCWSTSGRTARCAETRRTRTMSSPSARLR